MKIPFNHIKREVKNIDRHNQKNSERIERYQQSEREAIGKELLSAAKSEEFKREVKWDKKHPGHLQKVMKKIYGDKMLSH